MDLNSSLDTIIRRKGMSNHGNDSTPSRRRLPSSHRPSSASPSRPPRQDTRRDRRPPYKSDTTTGIDLRSRIGLQHHRLGDRPHHLDKSDLRGRIGKRVSSPSTGLSTSSLPNRQRLGQQRPPFKDDAHSILITKPVYGGENGSSSTREGFGKSDDVDPASIVITTKVNKASTTSEKKQQPVSPIRNESPPPSRQESSPEEQRQQQPNITSQENERSLQQYLQQQQQQEQQLRQQLQLQQQLQSQNQQIMELQRQLNQRTEYAAQHQPQPILHQLQQQQHHQQHSDPGRHFSFRPLMNEGPPPPHLLAPPSNRSNTVILSNLDPATSSTDVQVRHPLSIQTRFSL